MFRSVSVLQFELWLRFFCNRSVCCADTRFKRTHSTDEGVVNTFGNPTTTTKQNEQIHNARMKQRGKKVTLKVVNKHIMLNCLEQKKSFFFCVTFPQHYRCLWSTSQWLFLGRDFDKIVFNKTNSDNASNSNANKTIIVERCHTNWLRFIHICALHGVHGRANMSATAAACSRQRLARASQWEWENL